MDYEEGTIVENDAGEQLTLSNGQWIPVNDTSIANNLAAGIGSTAVAMGAPSIKHDPNSLAYMIGQAGDPAMIGAGEIMAPAINAGVRAVGGAGRGIVNKALGKIDDVAPTPTARPRMADRVLGRVDDASVKASEQSEQGRVMQGMFTPEEADAMGLPLTSANRAGLGGKAGADKLRRMEELRSTDSTFGGDIIATREAQKNWLDNVVKQDIGLPSNVALTPDAIGEVLTKQGLQFDEVGKQVGAVNPAELKAGFAESIKQITGSHAPQLKEISKVADRMIKKSPDGMLSGNDVMKLRSDLTKIMQAGTGQADSAKLYDASRMIQNIDDVIEKQTTGELKQAYSDLRRKYSITKKLMRPGVVSPDGRINAQSFRNSLLGSKNAAFKTASKDPIKKAAITSAYLQQKIIPSSGTAERLLANPGRTALQAGTATGIGGAGIAGINSILGD